MYNGHRSQNEGMCKSYLGIYFTQSLRKVRSVSWVDIDSWWTFEREKQVGSSLRITLCWLSVNKFWELEETRSFLANTFHFTNKEITAKGTELPKVTQPDNGTWGKPGLQTQWLQPSLLDLGKKCSIKRNEQELRKFQKKKKYLCCCGKIRRGEWIKWQTLAHEITRQ